MKFVCNNLIENENWVGSETTELSLLSDVGCFDKSAVRGAEV